MENKKNWFQKLFSEDMVPFKYITCSVKSFLENEQLFLQKYEDMIEEKEKELENIKGFHKINRLRALQRSLKEMVVGQEWVTVSGVPDWREAYYLFSEGDKDKVLIRELARAVSEQLKSQISKSIEAKEEEIKDLEEDHILAMSFRRGYMSLML